MKLFCQKLDGSKKSLKNSQKGSVLLVSLLVMGVLMVITLGLSDLVIREMRTQADVTKAGQAYYSAEAGIEEALYDVHQGLPGVNKSVDSELNNSEYGYKISGTAKSIPDLEGVVAPKEYHYNSLALNESVTIPLFLDDGSGKQKPAKKFYIAYYMRPFTLNIEESKTVTSSSSIGALGLDDFDVLRWKIFGLKKTVKPYRTESISDFISVGVKNDTPDSPRCFGSKIDTSECKTTIIVNKDGGSITLQNKDTGQQKEHDLPPVCAMNEARSYYQYDPTGDLEQVFENCYPISNFLDEHEFNYLTLTNAANPLMIKNNGVGDQVLPLSEREKLATIYYKIVAVDGELPLNDVQIRSRGEVGDLTQDIQVNVGREQFLPVFNFSLYNKNAE